MHCALIVAHGSPSSPDLPEAQLHHLAQTVNKQLPNWTVKGTSMAKQGALERAVTGLDTPLIYPFFMAEGWFTRHLLPRRLKETGLLAPRQLPAFGHSHDMPALLADEAQKALVLHRFDAPETTLVLAAHGSQKSRASCLITEQMADKLRQTTSFRAIITAYIEEAPFVHELPAMNGPALCLPFFATYAGHVLDDLPHALQQAGFKGPLLPPVGASDQTPALIARALQAAIQGETPCI